MMKFIALFALIAVAQAVPAGLVSTPLLAKLAPQPAEAPANTEHATHLAASVPVIHAPIGHLAPIAYSAPILAHSPLTYASGYAVAYAQPLEAHGYRISY